MSRRPGQSSRIGGCFLILFFGVFSAFGAGFLYAVLFTPENVEGSAWVGTIVSSVFLPIGLRGVYAGFRALLGKPAISRKPAPGAPAANATAGGLPTVNKLAPLSSGHYRLPPESSHRAQFFIFLRLAVFWNGIISIFVVQKFKGDGDDSAPWWFLGLFLAV